MESYEIFAINSNESSEIIFDLYGHIFGEVAKTFGAKTLAADTSEAEISFQVSSG